MFFRNRSSYSYETCAIVIGITPENLRVNWVWPSNYKGKWSFSPKSAFFQKWMIIQLWNLYHCDHHTSKPQGILKFHSSKYKGKWCFRPKMYFFFRNGSSYSFETCIIVNITPENLRVHWVWLSNYKGKWCFSPKCVFFLKNGSLYSFETMYHCNRQTWKPQSALKIGPLTIKESDVVCPKMFFFQKWISHTALKLVPLGSSCLKTSGCTEFGPLNTKKSDMFSQNVFFFSEMDHHRALKLVPLGSSWPYNLRVLRVWAL